MSASTIQFRCSERLRISMPVQVLVNDRPDEPFDCETLLVNLSGCGLRAPVSIPVGSQLHIRVGKDEVPGRVVTCIQVTGGDTFSVGVKFDEPYFWPVPNPPADWTSHPDYKARPSANKPAEGKRAHAKNSSTNNDPTPRAASSPVAISQSQEVVKQIDEAITRAMTIARKLDALAQLLPEQLESRLKKTAEDAASAAQKAAVADLETRLEAELQQKLAGVRTDRIEQCTAYLDTKLAELRQHADETTQSLTKRTEDLLEQFRRESAELRENVASESRKTTDELMRSAANLQVAAVDLEQQVLNSLNESIQSALNESMAKFEQHVKAASQRFASALHAAASHAAQPADVEEDGGETEDRPRRSKSNR